MTDKVFDNNQVIIAGEVVKDFEFSQDVFGEGFYIIHIDKQRHRQQHRQIRPWLRRWAGAAPDWPGE